VIERSHENSLGSTIVRFAWRGSEDIQKEIEVEVGLQKK
jgi:hypothetical protein